MKKIIALCLSFCMIMCTGMLAVAAEPETVLNRTEESSEEIIAYFDLVPTGDGITQLVFRDTEDQVLRDDEVNQEIQPRNQNWSRNITTGNTNYPFQTTRDGLNLKLHVYMSSQSDVAVYFARGSNVPALTNSNRKAGWQGTGHRYVDLLSNASRGYYSVYMFGTYTGTGYVYSEP